jgi:hypothetical protein
MPDSFAPRIGVVLEAFLEQHDVPEITDIEVGVGGYAPHPHCDVAALLASERSRTAWLDQISARGLRVGALNAWGNY